MKRLLLLSTVLTGTVLAASAPANATVYTLQDEYWVKNGVALSTVFAGATGTSTGGIYEETTTGPTPVITKLTSSALISGFHTLPLSGEITQNDGGSALLLNGGWTSTNFNLANPEPINNGGTGAGPSLTGAQMPCPSNCNATGSSLNFQYTTSATVNATTGTMTGAKSLFDLNSMQIIGASTAASFTIEGLLNGVVVDTANVSYNFVGGFNTFAPTGWTDIDTVAITNYAGGNNPLAIRDINISPDVANVPEPMTLALLGTGLIGLGYIRHARRSV